MAILFSRPSLFLVSIDIYLSHLGFYLLGDICLFDWLLVGREFIFPFIGSFACRFCSKRFVEGGDLVEVFVCERCQLLRLMIDSVVSILYFS